MKTRKQYLNGECTHREYYAQFVSDSVIRRVVNAIGAERIRASTDPNFNDIKLDYWDAIWLPSAFYDAFKSVGDTGSLAGLVCISKEAARQFLEQEKE